MQPATGGLSRGRSRSAIDAVGPLTAGRLAFLVFLGVLSVVMHETVRLPLKLPGHHGLEAMALLVIARLSCTHPFSATITALSSAMAAAAIGLGQGWVSPFLIILPGIVLDTGMLVFKRVSMAMVLVVLPFVAAIAHATKPLVRFGLWQGFDMHFGSFRHGLAWPIYTHLAFGFVGALIAVAMWYGWYRATRRE
ncbi:MAG: hypothetical protein ACK5KM_15640 [Hyphomicrobiaceae bacterium]